MMELGRIAFEYLNNYEMSTAAKCWLCIDWNVIQEMKGLWLRFPLL